MRKTRHTTSGQSNWQGHSHRLSFPTAYIYTYRARLPTPTKVDEKKKKVVKTIQFNNTFQIDDFMVKKFYIRRFAKKNVNPKTRYRTWDEAQKTLTKMGALGYNGLRTLVRVMQEQEGWTLEASFYKKEGWNSKDYRVWRAYNFKRGRERKVVMWKSRVKDKKSDRQLYLGAFHACVL